MKKKTKKKKNDKNNRKLRGNVDLCANIFFILCKFAREEELFYYLFKSFYLFIIIYFFNHL